MFDPGGKGWVKMGVCQRRYCNPSCLPQMRKLSPVPKIARLLLGLCTGREDSWGCQEQGTASPGGVGCEGRCCGHRCSKVSSM